MRLTQTLRAQHLDYWFKKKWFYHGKRVIRETGARAALEARGLSIADPKEIIDERVKFPPLILDSYLPKESKFDETHQHWHNEKCYMHGDSNLLLEGLNQAQLLTKTIIIDNLPKNIEESFSNEKILPFYNSNMQNAIKTSHLYDAEQKKLPKVKLPDRPAFNMPRVYGSTDSRRYRLLINKALLECEKLAGRSTVSMRKIISDAFFVVPFIRDDLRIQCELTAETFVTSKKPISVIDDNVSTNIELPDISPLKFTVSMPNENIYHKRNVYPILNGNTYMHPHTIILNFSKIETYNLYETEITESQIKARSMVKAFTVAAASARAQYGENVQDLPKPIVVQCIQTNGKFFYFGIYQLNSLNLNGTTGIKNYWYHHKNNIDLYKECSYISGKPRLHGYNSDVLKYLYTFYKNN